MSKIFYRASGSRGMERWKEEPACWRSTPSKELVESLSFGTGAMAGTTSAAPLEEDLLQVDQVDAPLVSGLLLVVERGLLAAALVMHGRDIDPLEQPPERALRGVSEPRPHQLPAGPRPEQLAAGRV